MNKTVTINIAGLFFHIDEDAYNKLNNYLEAIKRSINTEGREEIINDIESRIAEIFNERILPNSGVVRMSDVDYVVNVMGQPEDYILDDEDNVPYRADGNTSDNSYKNKKLFRDGEHRVLGGVLSGLGHYWNIDAVWLRIIFILLTFAYGSSIIIYPILWIIIPKAKTTADILQMKGQPVNISNIEKKIKENFNEFGERIKSYDTTKIQNTGKNVADVLMKIIGAFLIFIGISGMIGAFIGTYAILNVGNTNFPIDKILNEGYPLWAITIAFFGMIFIPVLIILLLGIKIVYNNVRYIGLISILLGFIFAICVTYFCIVMIDIESNSQKKFTKLFRENMKTSIVKRSLEGLESDTLYLNFIRDPRIYTVNDTITDDKFYEEFRNVYLDIYRTNETTPYIEVKSSSLSSKKIRGVLSKSKSEFEITEVPNMLEYFTEFKGNKIELASAIVSTNPNSLNTNKVELMLYLPKNKVIQIDSKDHNLINYYNNPLSEGTHYYKFENTDWVCASCENNTN